jgi:tetratricopeptide (TPR) repeat protein
MLTKNEAEHLDRTLPAWAKIIDYWIIGIDDANSDNSEEVIQKHLGHIPGATVVVKFDGMGPTWSILVEEGLKRYPEATHGIIADADFKPMSDKLDKMQLDIRCSKHMYTVWTETHDNERKMDWIYRNIPGAVVKRRTHQTLEVPELPNQEVFQTLIDLAVEERTGGYQDRTPGKNKRYIQFLEDDLVDYPNDARTLYYLGYAHYDNFKKVHEISPDGAPEEAWDELRLGMDYMEKRMASDGNEEERWFTVLKYAEIQERYLGNWEMAEKYYRECIETDKERADPYFYIGQRYRLRGEPRKSLDMLEKAATLPTPQRSLFQWHHLYNCLSNVEYARAVGDIEDAEISLLKKARRILSRGDCNFDRNVLAEQSQLLDQLVIRERVANAKTKGKSGNYARVKLTKRVLKHLGNQLDDLEDELVNASIEEDEDVTLFHALLQEMRRLNDFVSKFKKIKGQNTPKPTCRDYRLATTSYLKFTDQYREEIEE